MGKILDLPALDYFTSKNIYVGSHTNTFRFRIEPVDDKLKADIWHADICYELCTVDETGEFPLNAEGLSACVDWIESRIL